MEVDVEVFADVAQEFAEFPVFDVHGQFGVHGGEGLVGYKVDVFGFANVEDDVAQGDVADLKGDVFVQEDVHGEFVVDVVEGTLCFDDFSEGFRDKGGVFYCFNGFTEVGARG